VGGRLPAVRACLRASQRRHAGLDVLVRFDSCDCLLAALTHHSTRTIAHSFHEVARRELRRFLDAGVSLTFVFDNRFGVRLCLFCSVQFSSVLFCSVLFCSVLFCSVLFCSVLSV
jgi:hypothetical protein